MTDIPLIDGATSTGAGSSKGTVGAQQRADGQGVAQAVISGTATVKLQGSLDGSNWFDLAEFSASGGVSFSVPPHIRGNVSDYTSGTVDLDANI